MKINYTKALQPLSITDELCFELLKAQALMNPIMSFVVTEDEFKEIIASIDPTAWKPSDIQNLIDRRSFLGVPVFITDAIDPTGTHCKYRETLN